MMGSNISLSSSSLIPKGTAIRRIEHKDVVTVLNSFAYVLDDVGNVESVTQVDGSIWDYAYDGRYRLTSAVRDNANTSPTITATYAYTYDDGDHSGHKGTNPNSVEFSGALSVLCESWAESLEMLCRGCRIM